MVAAKEAAMGGAPTRAMLPVKLPAAASSLSTLLLYQPWTLLLPRLVALAATAEVIETEWWMIGPQALWYPLD